MIFRCWGHATSKTKSLKIPCAYVFSIRKQLFLVVFTGFLNNSSAETDPVAHWSFDEGEGNITHDSSGNANNGTLENGPIWVDGIDGGALDFDGIDCFEHFRSPNLEATSKMSLHRFSRFFFPIKNLKINVYQLLEKIQHPPKLIGV